MKRKTNQKNLSKIWVKRPVNIEFWNAWNAALGQGLSGEFSESRLQRVNGLLN